MSYGLIKVTCPACGGEQEEIPGIPEAECDRCGATIHLARDAATAPAVDDAPFPVSTAEVKVPAAPTSTPADPTAFPAQAKAPPPRPRTTIPPKQDRPLTRSTIRATPGATDKAATKALMLLGWIALVAVLVGVGFAVRRGAPTTRSRKMRDHRRKMRKIEESLRRLDQTTRSLRALKRRNQSQMKGTPQLPSSPARQARKLKLWKQFQAKSGFKLAPPVMRILNKLLKKHNLPYKGSPSGSLKVLLLIPYTTKGCMKYRYSIARTLQKMAPLDMRRLQIFFAPYPSTQKMKTTHAAQAAYEAARQRGRTGFFAFHRQLINSSSWRRRPKKLLAFAQKAGLNEQAFSRALAQKRHDRVAFAVRRFARNMGFPVDEPLVIIGNWAYREQVTHRLPDAIQWHLNSPPVK